MAIMVQGDYGGGDNGNIGDGVVVTPYWCVIVFAGVPRVVYPWPLKYPGSDTQCSPFSRRPDSSPHRPPAGSRK